VACGWPRPLPLRPVRAIASGVTKLDRLGRDAIDVSSTVAKLAELGVRVHCLALGGVDLTSAAGRMTMGVINHVAQFERDLLIERRHAGLARAKAGGSA
jgi:putative DNA-invertase from lambdoid prophage Rac